MVLLKNLFKSISSNSNNKGNDDIIYAFGIPLYSNYKYKPWINPDRTKEELQKLYDSSLDFPGILVQKEAITFYDTLGIFRGDIIALNWIKKNNDKNKKIPQYFEKRYGINFFQSIDRLERNGYLISSINTALSENVQINALLTSKGQKLLIQNSEVLFSNNSYHNGLTDSELLKQAKLQDSKSFCSNDKAFYDSLLKRGVISQDEYKQAFDDRVEADKAIEELRNKRKKKNDILQGKSIVDNLSNIQFQNYMNERLMADRIAIDNKDYHKSNEILWNIYKRIKYTNFDRLEKNYRKLKEYDKEIDVIKIHIKSIESQEWETDFDGKKVDRLNERLAKLISSKNNNK